MRFETLMQCLLVEGALPSTLIVWQGKGTPPQRFKRGEFFDGFDLSNPVMGRMNATTTDSTFISLSNFVNLRQ